ncbi:unnamed protein product [Ranitomeya imitator]|uniref:SGNH hydrolase-type esterase domain-containing protein n=1 Tax=Ranitomeya imitator TaxID=111125 RepID=A0ABN9M738_9NEOB|nr:unnamed protein product [Ranitomeya imitator]
MEFRLPQDKISKLRELIAGCLAVGKVTLVQMQSLLGSLNFACKVMPMGRIFSRRLILATKGVKLPHHRIRITAQLHSDLIIWQRFLFSYNGKTTCFQEDECDSDSLGLRLDTVDAVDFSVSFRDQTCTDTWPESWVTRAWTQDSVLLELLPLAAAMELWGQFLGNKCGMVSSRGYSSKSWDARIRSGMPWRADSFVKVFHRSFHLESIRASAGFWGVGSSGSQPHFGGGVHFKLRSWSDSTKHFLIAQVLKGWRWASARSDQRRPISFTLLSNLVRVSGSICDSDYEATLISAAFSLAFFGAMRVSEILPSSRCRAGGLQLEDLVICDDGLRVRVRRSKTDQEGRGIWFPLFAIKGSICPLVLIKSYMQIRGNGPQLFIHENGSPLFACQFLAILRQALAFLGLPAADFGTHSFRIGAATEASRAGLFESDIQRLNNCLFLVSDGMRPSIWLVGHSYKYWAARRAELCPGGRSLGFTGMDVIWHGTRGLTWSQVLPEVVRIARVASSPTVVVIHAGGNDLASFPLAELLTLMRADLDKLPGFFPVMRLVWSEMIPRLVWRGARELSAMERSRRTLNQRISHFIRFKNGVVVRHHRLEGDNSGFLLPDGVHLTNAGLDIFLDGLREGVVQALHSLGGS